MKKLIFCSILPLFAGCLSSSVPDCVSWTIEYKDGAASAKKAKYGVARVTQVLVRAPYQTESLAVLRADGSMAFDAYNGYAASPAQLLRGVVFDAVTDSGLFEAVLPSTSIATSQVSVEVQVIRLVLDCREDDGALRAATAEVLMRLVDAKGDIVKTARATDLSAVRDRNFGEAFSAAISSALAKALEQMR